MTDTSSCPACGTPIPIRPGPGRQRIWCSDACRTWVAGQRKSGRPVAATRERREGRACVSCGMDISGRTMSAKYCSDRCGEIARGQRLPAALPKRTCELPECGKPFQPYRTEQRCCSEKHGKLLYNRESRADGRQKPSPWNDRSRDRYHRRRARVRETSTDEPVLREQIAERDGWRCHLCGERVGKTRSWPHPRSASLDHLVPLSRGGTHEPSNVRLAHLICNTTKGNRARGEQLLLIG